MTVKGFGQKWLISTPFNSLLNISGKSDLEIYERPLIKENYYKLYYTTKESTFFNFKILLFEIFKALCQGVVIAAVTICSVEQ